MGRLKLYTIFFLGMLSFQASADPYELEYGVLRQKLTFSIGWQTIAFSGLDPNEQYGFRLTGSTNVLQPESIKITGGKLLSEQEGVFFLQPSTDQVSFALLFHPMSPEDVLPDGFSIWCHSCKQVAPEERAIGVDYLPLDLIIEQTLFTGAGCWDFRNYSFLGEGHAIGTFHSAPYMSYGMIMSTGSITNALGINNSPSVGTDWGLGGDLDLTASLFGTPQTYDASILELDFTAPFTGALQLTVMFASEEYPSGNCDAFGIFCSGPGITGPFSGNAQNFALAPGSSYPINACNIGPNSLAPYYIDNTDGKDMQYDGFTIPMKISIPIQECGEYHLKFAIADTGDGLYDSAVLIEGNDLGYILPATMELIVPSSNSNVLYEECSDGFLRICRVNNFMLFDEVELNYTIHSGSTAQSGVDYNPFPASFVIPAPDDCVDIPISAIADLLPEGDESIILSLDSPCMCNAQTVEIILRDTPPLEITLDDISVCQDDPFSLEPEISSGVEDFTYLWSDGSEDAELQLDTQIPGSQTYSVTVTDECGQSKTASAKVDIIARPTATMEGDGYLCKGNTKDTIPVTITLGPPSTAPWSVAYYINGVLQPVLTNITTPVITIPVTTPGFSQIQTVYNQSVCEGYTNGESFIEAVVIKATLDTIPVSCFGIEDGALTAMGQEGFEPYTYQWSVPGEKNALLDSIGVGKYFVTVTDQLGCTVVDSVDLTSQTDIIVDGILLNGTDCATPTGAVDLTVNGGEFPYTFLWSNGSILQDPTNLPEGTAFVTVTDNKGCESYASFPIPVPDAPDITPSVTGTVTCATPNGGAANLQVTGGTTPYGFAWSGNGGNMQNPVNLTGGTYTVTVTDAAGCSVMGSVDIPVDTLTPFAQVGPSDTLTCGVTTLVLDGSGSTSGQDIVYQWTTANGQILSGGTTLQPEIGLPGLYTLLVSNVTNGCTASAGVQILPDQNAPGIQILPADTLSCSLTSTVLDATGSTSGPNIQISWSTSNGQIVSGGNTLQPTVGSPGTYTLILTNTVNNCVATEDVIVPGLNALLNADIAGPTLITCTNPVITLDGTGSVIPPGSSYAWSTSNGNIVGSASGSTIQIDDAGNYTLVVTDPASGCTDQISFNVAIDQAVPVSVGQPDGILTCVQKTVVLDGSNSSSGPDMQYLWTTTTGSLTGPAQNSTTQCNAPGTYTLLVTDTGNGCTSSVNINVQIDTLSPQASAGVTDQIDCIDPSISLQGSGQTFSGTAQIQWTTSNGNILSGATTYSPLVNQAGTYQLLVTDLKNGCTASNTVTITSDFSVPTVIIALPPVLTCASPNGMLDATASVSGPQITPTWTTINGTIISGAGTYTPTVNTPGTYKLVQVDATSGCKDSASVVVIENKIQPLADAGSPSQIACLGDSAQLNGTGSSTGANMTYDWYLNLANPPVITNQIIGYTKAAGTYTLVVTDNNNGCTDSSTVTIPADFLNDAVLTLIDKYCDDDVSDLQVGPVAGGVEPYVYSIDDGSTQQVDPLFRKLGPGIYPVLVTDGKGCTWREEIEILEEEGVIVTLPDDMTIELSDEVSIVGEINVDPSTVTQLTWYPPYGLDRTDSLIVLAKPGIAVLYTLTVQDERGCIGIDSITIVVHDPDIFIPTVFSPYNDDGVNDRFTIFGETKGLVQIDRFEVFSRWGERLYSAENFQPNDPNIGWDGTRSGHKLNPGVYVYYAQIQLTDGRVEIRKGEVILVK